MPEIWFRNVLYNLIKYNAKNDHCACSMNFTADAFDIFIDIAYIVTGGAELNEILAFVT